MLAQAALGEAWTVNHPLRGLHKLSSHPITIDIGCSLSLIWTNNLVLRAHRWTTTGRPAA